MAGSITLFYYDMYVWPRQGLDCFLAIYHYAHTIAHRSKYHEYCGFPA